MKASTIKALEAFVQEVCVTVSKVANLGPGVDLDPLNKKAAELLMELPNEDEYRPE